MGEMGFCFLLILIVIIGFTPGVFMLAFAKKKTQKEFERSDADKHRYYPVVYSKQLKTAVFFELISVCCVILPIVPMICIPLVFPAIKPWMAIIFFESLGILCIFIYYRFLVFDIEYIELDRKNLEIVHKKGKRELYSLVTYKDFYERTYRVKYSTNTTRGLIFEIAGQKKEVNLDFLDDKGFEIFNKDLQTLIKTGVLPIERVPQNTDDRDGIQNVALITETPNVSTSGTEKTSSNKANVTGGTSSDKAKATEGTSSNNEKISETGIIDLTEFAPFIFIKNLSKEEIEATLKEYDELYTDAPLFTYRTGLVLGTPWNYAEMVPSKTADKESLIWEYLNILIWFSDKSKVLFAYAIPNDPKEFPIYATFDFKNPFGDTCDGYMLRKQFKANIPERSIEWDSKEVPKKFDCQIQVEDYFSFRKEWFGHIDYLYAKSHSGDYRDNRPNPVANNSNGGSAPLQENNKNVGKASTSGNGSTAVNGAESEIQWNMRITNREFNVNDYTEFNVNLDEGLTAVEMGDEEFLILEPSIPQKGVSFIQVCLDRDSDMHIEVALNKMGANGLPVILCKDGVTAGECLDIFSDFYEGWDVSTDGYYELKL